MKISELINETEIHNKILSREQTYCKQLICDIKVNRFINSCRLLAKLIDDFENIFSEATYRQMDGYSEMVLLFKSNDLCEVFNILFNDIFHDDHSGNFFKTDEKNYMSPYLFSDKLCIQSYGFYSEFSSDELIEKITDLLRNHHEGLYRRYNN